LQAATDPGMS